MAAPESVAALSDWARLRLFGPDCRKFLHGLVTADILGLPERGGCPSLLLTPKGRLQANFYVCALKKDELLLLCPPSSAGELRGALAKMVMLSESKLEDGGAGAWLVFSSPEKESFSYARWGGALRLDEPPASLPRLSAEELEALRVERGIPAYGVDVGAETIPLEAPVLEDAISYTKGCYMGQETISRVHHMGHVNKLLTTIRSSQDPRGQEGVTSAAYSPRLECWLALATRRAP